jgi:hypothetical protein
VDDIENWRLTAGNTPTQNYWHTTPAGGYPDIPLQISTAKNYIKLSMESALWAGNIPASWNDGSEIEMLVDWVRVYDLE